MELPDMFRVTPEGLPATMVKKSVPHEGGAATLVHVTEPETCCDDAWEAAYARFETPEREIRKFIGRLRKLGAERWPRDAEVVELFCGRGSGLHALTRLGFTRVEGVDLSASLVAQYVGSATHYVGDCRQLPFLDSSKDVVLIQGGLHHLPLLPADLDRTLAESYRVLREDGHIAVVEPWLTPFLAIAHCVCRNTLARRLSRKVDALATMIHYEQKTYDQWLGQPHVVLNSFQKYFQEERCSIGWGKLFFVGRKMQHRLQRKENFP
jgi:ubiquinone/menaquinone biosynthesis C-methylase UbiE